MLPPVREATVNEKELQGGIVDMAHRFGWAVAHFPAIRVEWGFVTAVSADGKGFPDLCLVRDRLLFAEVKVGRNTLRAEQRAWRDRLAAAGVEWHLWNEKDWADGSIEEVLR